MQSGKNLFSRLLALHNLQADMSPGDEQKRSRKPKEDFFTEVFAFIADKHREIVLYWLAAKKIISLPGKSDLNVETQKGFPAPPGFSGRSRIDAVLKISQSEVVTDLVFLESKLDSSQNNDQLKKYAAILKEIKKNQDGSPRKWLLYVTRDFEEVEEKDRPTEDGEIKFRQLRWHQFYDILVLEKYVNEPFIAEMIKFMEDKEIRMNQVKTFTPEDVTTIGNIKSAVSVMEATLDGEITSEFEEIMGEQARMLQRSNGLVNLGRYACVSDFIEGTNCAMGYFAGETPGKPLVGIRINIKPECAEEQKTRIIARMKKFIETRKDWKSLNLDNTSTETWSRIERVKSLDKFRETDDHDHVGKVREFFLKLLGELKLFKKQVV